MLRVLKPGTEKDAVYSPPFLPPCCHPLLATTAHEGPGHREKPHSPIPDTIRCKHEDTPESFGPHPFPQDGIAFEVEDPGGK